MNPKMWKSIPLAAVCVATLLAGGHAALGASDEALDEAGMIGVLESGADWWDKQAACRGLRKIGTAKSVPALAALLPDEELSSMARFALERQAHRLNLRRQRFEQAELSKQETALKAWRRSYAGHGN